MIGRVISLLLILKQTALADWFLFLKAVADYHKENTFKLELNKIKK
jgi:hypothetical protein